MVLLTALLSFLCIIASWRIDKAVKGYFALFLLLETGHDGRLLRLDFFLFYVFWEVMLLPMYFLIGIWGGPRREYAAIKFFLYTLAGSVLMLLAHDRLLSERAGPHHGRPHVQHAVHDGPGQPQLLAAGHECSAPVWIALFIGFAIKVPIFPFHTWLPDAHVEAPTAVSRHPGRRAAEDGHLRHPADQLPRSCPRPPAVLCLRAGRARGDQHPVRGLLRHGADRHEEAGGLLLGQPHGLRAAGHGR